MHNHASINVGVFMGILDLVMPVRIVYTSSSGTTVCKSLINANATSAVGRITHNTGIRSQSFDRESHMSHYEVAMLFKAKLSNSFHQRPSMFIHFASKQALGGASIYAASSSPSRCTMCYRLHVSFVIRIEAGRCGGRLHTDIAPQ
jgi:hypothetical protein